VSLRATTFMSVLEDVLSELKRSGFRNIMLYNWHFENSNFVYEPAFLVSEQNPELKIVIVEDVFPEFTPERRNAIWPDGFPGLALEHAAVIETSLWMHYDASAVRTERMSTSSGSLSSPMGASAEIGKMLTQWLVERVVAIVDDEFAQRTSTRDGQQ